MDNQPTQLGPDDLLKTIGRQTVVIEVKDKIIAQLHAELQAKSMLLEKLQNQPKEATTDDVSN